MPMTRCNKLLSIDILFESPLWAKSKLSARNRVNDVLSVTWDNLPKRPKGVIPECTVTLSNDSKIRLLNKNYRSKDKPTNVLSFPMFNHMDEIPSHAGAVPIGDIIIAFETIKAEAIEQNKLLSDHFTHMLIHGFLHLLGYDHMNDKEAKSMESLEIKILKKLGIDNPYLPR
jgi:probable rRNA maturation factor